MVSVVKPVAVILGVGDGLSASVARLLHRQGYDLVLGARNIEKFQDLTTELQATSVVCDATQPQQVQGLFAACPRPPTVALYNPSLRVKGPIQEVDPQQMKRAMEITGYGSFLFGQEAAKVMLEPKGTILFTGASAGVKGFPQSAAFAMGKFAQRGLAQSMARELHVRVCVRLCVLDPVRREVDDTTLSCTNFSFAFSRSSFWLACLCLFVRAVFSLFG